MTYEQAKTTEHLADIPPATIVKGSEQLFNPAEMSADVADYGLDPNKGFSIMGSIITGNDAEMLILTYRDDTNRVSGYFLSPVVEKVVDGVQTKSTNGVHIPIGTDPIRIGRDKQAVETGSSYGLADLGLNSGDPLYVSRDQMVITATKFGVKLENVGGGLLQVRSQELDEVRSFPMPENKVVPSETPPDPVQSIVLKGEPIPVVMTPEAETDDKVQRLDGAHDLLAEALGDKPAVDPVAEASARVLNLELPDHRPAAEGTPVPAVLAPPAIPASPALAPSSVERVIREQIDQLQRGEGNPVVVKLEQPAPDATPEPVLEQEPEPVQEVEAVEAEVERSPDEIVAEALSDPAKFKELYAKRDTDLEKQTYAKLRTIVGAWRRYVTAKEAIALRDTVLTPKAEQIIAQAEAEAAKFQDIEDAIGDFPQHYRQFGNFIGQGDMQSAGQYNQAHRPWVKADELLAKLKPIASHEQQAGDPNMEDSLYEATRSLREAKASEADPSIEEAESTEMIGLVRELIGSSAKPEDIAAALDAGSKDRMDAEELSWILESANTVFRKGGYEASALMQDMQTAVRLLDEYTTDRATAKARGNTMFDPDRMGDIATAFTRVKSQVGFVAHYPAKAKQWLVSATK